MSNASKYTLEPETFTCRGCNAEEQQILCGEEQFLRTGQQLVLCGMCGLGYLSPDFTDEALSRFYAKDYRRISLIDATANYDAQFFQQVLYREFARLRVKLVAADLPPSARVLEIGSGFGAFLSELHRARPDVVLYATETDEAHRRLLLQDVPVTFLNPQQIESEAPFDAIVVIHTLEHLKQPVAELAQCARTLRPDTGKVYIEVPDILADWGNWLFVLPAHLSYFSSASLTRCFTRAGLNALAIGAHPAGEVLIGTIWAVGKAGKLQHSPSPASEEEIAALLSHISRYRWNRQQAIRNKARALALRLLGANRLGNMVRRRFHQRFHSYFITQAV